MRKLIWIATAVLALAGVGMAVAQACDSGSVSAVSATFTATSAGSVKTSTCTAADGTYAKTDAEYTGTAASSEPSLNGPVTIDARSLINTTTGYGVVTGSMRFGNGGDNAGTHFEAVYSNGNIAGFAEGNSHNPQSELLANLSGAYSATGGFTNGMLGGGTSGGSAVLVSQGGCRPVPAPRPDTIKVHGAVSAVSSTSITAAGVTCSIPTSLQAVVAGLNLTTGSEVDMKCTASSGTNTLAGISTRGNGYGHPLIKHVLNLHVGHHRH